MIDKEEVKHIASLAELEFDEDTLDEMVAHIDGILEHVHKVSSVDTKDLRPTSHVLDIKNVYREDEPWPSLSQEEALKNGPDVQDGGFKVPKID